MGPSSIEDKQRKNFKWKLRPSVMSDIRIWLDFWATVLKELTGTLSKTLLFLFVTSYRQQ